MIIVRKGISLFENLIGGSGMPQIKSAKKRVITDAKKGARNLGVRSEVKTAAKKVVAAVETNDKANAEASLKSASVDLNKAVSKGVLHKNTASRKVSRLAKKVAKLEK